MNGCLCRWVWNTAVSVCTVETHAHINTHTHTSSHRGVVWDEQVNSFEREFVPFFSLIILLLSVIKQTNRKIVLKNLAYAFSIKCFKI